MHIRTTWKTWSLDNGTKNSSRASNKRRNSWDALKNFDKTLGTGTRIIVVCSVVETLHFHEFLNHYSRMQQRFFLRPEPVSCSTSDLSSSWKISTCPLRHISHIQNLFDIILAAISGSMMSLSYLTRMICYLYDSKLIESLKWWLRWVVSRWDWRKKRGEPDAVAHYSSVHSYSSLWSEPQNPILVKCKVCLQNQQKGKVHLIGHWW